MSWWFAMEVDVGGPERLDVCEGLNCTYNVAPMFRKALKEPGGIRALHGKTGEESIPLLRGAIEDMEDGRAAYVKMNPPNGWGSADSALETLRTLLCWSLKAPKATIRVC